MSDCDHHWIPRGAQVDSASCARCGMVAELADVFPIIAGQLGAKDAEIERIKHLETDRALCCAENEQKAERLEVEVARLTHELELSARRVEVREVELRKAHGLLEEERRKREDAERERDDALATLLGDRDRYTKRVVQLTARAERSEAVLRQYIDTCPACDRTGIAKVHEVANDACWACGPARAALAARETVNRPAVDAYAAAIAACREAKSDEAEPGAPELEQQACHSFNCGVQAAIDAIEALAWREPAEEKSE